MKVIFAFCSLCPPQAVAAPRTDAKGLWFRRKKFLCSVGNLVPILRL